MSHRNQVSVYYSDAKKRWYAVSALAATGATVSGSGVTPAAALTAFASAAASWNWDQGWKPASNERAPGT